VPTRRPRPDVKSLAASNPPPSLGGKAGLFAIPSPAPTTATASPLAGQPDADAPARVPRHVPARPTGLRPIRRSSELPIHRASLPQRPTGTTLERSYVLDRDQDRLLHLISARTGRNLSDIVQEALTELLRDRGVDQADLEALDKGPIEAGAAPTRPRPAHRDDSG
jgi:Arc/MetJ-type ribon-helix-helix transcriptional regulator